MISKIKEGWKASETYIIGAIALAGVVQYFISANTGIPVEDTTPIRVLADLKASGIHDMNVDDIIKFTDAINSSKTGADFTGLFGLGIAAFLSVVNAINRIALKYKEISTMAQAYRETKTPINEPIGPKVDTPKSINVSEIAKTAPVNPPGNE